MKRSVWVDLTQSEDETESSSDLEIVHTPLTKRRRVARRSTALSLSSSSPSSFTVLPVFRLSSLSAPLTHRPHSNQQNSGTKALVKAQKKKWQVKGKKSRDTATTTVPMKSCKCCKKSTGHLRKVKLRKAKHKLKPNFRTQAPTGRIPFPRSSRPKGSRTTTKSSTGASPIRSSAAKSQSRANAAAELQWQFLNESGEYQNVCDKMNGKLQRLKKGKIKAVTVTFAVLQKGGALETHSYKVLKTSKSEGVQRNERYNTLRHLRLILLMKSTPTPTPTASVSSSSSSTSLPSVPASSSGSGSDKRVQWLVSASSIPPPNIHVLHQMDLEQLVVGGSVTFGHYTLAKSGRDSATYKDAFNRQKHVLRRHISDATVANDKTKNQTLDGSVFNAAAQTQTKAALSVSSAPTFPPAITALPLAAATVMSAPLSLLSVPRRALHRSLPRPFSYSAAVPSMYSSLTNTSAGVNNLVSDLAKSLKKAASSSSSAAVQTAVSGWSETFVRTAFSQSLPSARIVSVKRMDGACNVLRLSTYVHMAQLCAFKSQHLVFHGTDAGTVPKIEANGFNRDFNATAQFGKGVYFSNNVQLADQYTGHRTFVHSMRHRGGGAQMRHMFACLLGVTECQRGHASMTVPPLAADGVTQVDTLVDNLQTPMIFVAMRDDRVVPVFLIKYQ